MLYTMILNVMIYVYNYALNIILRYRIVFSFFRRPVNDHANIIIDIKIQ